jgi:hypothetical protein
VSGACLSQLVKAYSIVELVEFGSRDKRQVG